MDSEPNGQRNTPSGAGGLLGTSSPQTIPLSVGPPIAHIAPDGTRADLPEPCIWDERRRAWWPKRFGPLSRDSDTR
jgi:hypothetical protein